ncbi:MAG TPA: twin-arginine translocase subunit TatC [Solirubrobacteraceae bacterium]|nr:twin-arginine translocase subunit TatC [Solirubrobacteraceae bacterium]
MARAIRTVGHEDRLSLVDHLDELRQRLIASGIVLAIAFGVCLWQNHALLKIINKPLTTQTRKQVANGEGTVGQAVVAQRAALHIAQTTQAALTLLAAPHSGLAPQTRAQLPPLIASLRRVAGSIPRTPPGQQPATLGVGEPFTTTITVALYFALIIALPFILYEVGGFVMPALKPNERRAVLPLLTAVPFLFVAGVLFGYFIVLPAATRFLVNFNSGEFNIIVQASQFYSFAATVLLAMGLVFQVPVLILGATSAGLVTPAQLRRGRRYAIVACAAVAAFLPGDAITLLLETIPLYVLYEASILLASFVGRRARLRDASSNEGGGSEQGPAAEPGERAEPTVQDMIDHVDPRL